MRILGCDGREPSDGKERFWKHDARVQINAEMAAIRRVHPAFFAIDLDDYYERHCDTLERWLRHGEAVGPELRQHVEVVHPGATAPRPARRVHRAGAAPAPRPAAPRGQHQPEPRGPPGHHLHLDRTLRALAGAAGLDFVSLANAGLDPKAAGGTPVVLVFRDTAWRIRDTDADEVEARFGAELCNAALELERLDPDTPNVFFSTRSRRATSPPFSSSGCACAIRRAGSSSTCSTCTRTSSAPDDCAPAPTR